jgi:hypothetical protein
MCGSSIRGGLQEACLSRARIDAGIPASFARRIRAGRSLAGSVVPQANNGNPSTEIRHRHPGVRSASRGRCVSIEEQTLDGGCGWASFPSDLSYPDCLDLRAAIVEPDGRGEAALAVTLSGMLAIQQVPVGLGDADAASQRTWIAAVSDNFFTVPGVEPWRGRLFADGEGRAPGADQIVVLTHDCWSRRFGANPNIVGRQ